MWERCHSLACWLLGFAVGIVLVHSVVRLPAEPWSWLSFYAGALGIVLWIVAAFNANERGK